MAVRPSDAGRVALGAVGLLGGLVIAFGSHGLTPAEGGVMALDAVAYLQSLNPAVRKLVSLGIRE